ncbi:MAG: hypothetical protein L0229_29450 [Blastocatellia bacterium]|nr:hypothetical protein [Blastocatellia bacterium]
MKRVSLPVICLFMLSCGMDSQGPITFKLAQPLGQKSKYNIKHDIKLEVVQERVPDGSEKMAAAMDAIFETEVTASLPDGSWTLDGRFARIDMAVDGESIEEAKGLMENRPFVITMDKTGKVLDVSGTNKVLPGTDIKQMVFQIIPLLLLSTKPVAVGESWPIEISLPVEMQGTSFQQKIKGTGTLKEVGNGRAVIDIIYDMEMFRTEQGDESMSMTWTGKSKYAMTFDIEKARVITSKIDSTMEVIGRERSEHGEEVGRSFLSNSMQINLVGE